MINLKDYTEEDRAEIISLSKEAIGYDGRFSHKDKQYIAKHMVYGGVGIYLIPKSKNKCPSCSTQKQKSGEEKFEKNQVSFTKEEEAEFNEKVNIMLEKNQNAFVFKNFLFNYYIKDGKLTFRGVLIIKENAKAVVNA